MTTTVDFSIRDEGSIVLLRPLSDNAKVWVTKNIGEGNGFQPYWPTVIIERPYVQPILEGIAAEGLCIGPMAKVINHGAAKPDDPMFQQSYVISTVHGFEKPSKEPSQKNKPEGTRPKP